MLVVRMANYPIHLLSYPQPIVITFTLYKYHQKNSDFPGNQLLKFYPKFSILMYYSCLSSPICLKIIISYSTIKIEVLHLACTLELGCSNNPTTLRILTQRQRYMNKMFDRCPKERHISMNLCIILT